jgi:hypothetical protein
LIRPTVREIANLQKADKSILLLTTHYFAPAQGFRKTGLKYHISMAMCLERIKVKKF